MPIRRLYRLLTLAAVAAVLALGPAACQSVKRASDLNAQTQAQQTIDLLQQGVANVGRRTARRDIEAWQQRLRAEDAPALDAVAATLDDLEAALDDERVDAQATGALLEQLSGQTRAAVQTRPDAAPARLERLADLLAQVGEQIRG